MPQPYMASYGAAKAYILAFGDALYHEMKDKRVDVSVLSPGPTDTPMAAGTGIDFAAMGMQVMQPAPVAAYGLAALGNRPDAIPGARNRMMAFMTTRLMPRRWVGAMLKMMMGKALRNVLKPISRAGQTNVRALPYRSDPWCVSSHLYRRMVRDWFGRI
jgi:short-subunit dehydrogenase